MIINVSLTLRTRVSVGVFEPNTEKRHAYVCAAFHIFTSGLYWLARLFNQAAVGYLRHFPEYQNEARMW